MRTRQLDSGVFSVFSVTEDELAHLNLVAPQYTVMVARKEIAVILLRKNRILWGRNKTSP